MKRALVAALALLALVPEGAAQNAITQEGTVLQNSPMMFRGNNRARQGAPVGGAPSGQIVTTGDAVVGGRCDYSAPIDAPEGYAKLCLDAKNGSIELGGTAPPTCTMLLVRYWISLFFVRRGNRLAGPFAVAYGRSQWTARWSH